VVTGRKADVMLAAYHAAEVALRLVKPGIEVNLTSSVLLRIIIKNQNTKISSTNMHDCVCVCHLV